MTTQSISRRMILAGVSASLSLSALGPALAAPMISSQRPKPRPAGAAGVPDAAAPAPRQAPKGADLVQEARLGGATGYAVIDGATGQVLDAFNGQTALPPASVAKTVTALYGLDRLGPGYRFTTRVLATGPVVGGMVQGDLALVGGGDPTLSTDDLGDLVARLAAMGLRGATGQFVVFADHLPQIDRLDDEQPVYAGYNPALSGLNLNFNRVYFEWARAGGDWQLGMDARGARFVPPVQMATVRVVQREAPLFTYDAGSRSDAWTVAAGALGKGGSRWLPVRHPAVYTAEVFRTLAAAKGITALPPATLASGAPPATATELDRHLSGPLDGILRDMLRHSTNLTAECVGLSASGAGGLAPSGRAMSDWAGARLGMGSQFHDHSGLGATSRTTPLDMAHALAAADRNGAGLRGILREVGMRDAQGKPLKSPPAKVLAKTGTLNFCSGLAGYVVPPKGNPLVFAIFSADVPRRAALGPDQREKPAGLAPWLARARNLQGQLIAGWAQTYLG